MTTRSARHRHAAPVAFGRDRFASRQDADRRRVAVVPVAHRPLDRLDQVRRRLEAEDDRVADIEIADVPAGGLNLSGLRHDIADRVDEATNP